MTTPSHVHDPVIRDARIRAEASQVQFLPFLGHLLRAILLGIFSLIGWIFGTLWFSAVYCALAVKYGFLQGAHAEVPPPRQPSIPQ